MEIDKVKELINLQKNNEAISALDNCKLIIEEYADSYSKNQNIKNESIKRKERISKGKSSSKNGESQASLWFNADNPRRSSCTMLLRVAQYLRQGRNQWLPTLGRRCD